MRGFQPRLREFATTPRTHCMELVLRVERLGKHIQCVLFWSDIHCVNAAVKTGLITRCTDAWCGVAANENHAHTAIYKSHQAVA
jgi:hypothetical protein